MNPEMADEEAMNCARCEEPIQPGEETFTYANGPVAHWNCHLRGVLGSVAHIQHRCGCFVPGSSEGDPPGLTLRQAADAAVAEYEKFEKR